MPPAHDFGRFCETFAVRHLTRTGWRILATNYRLGHKEIDIVARRGQVVAFVEVKGRSGTDFGHPLEAVTRAKRREIARVATHWIARNGRPDEVYRFDAIAVLKRRGGHCRLQHVEDAWRLD